MSDLVVSGATGRLGGRVAARLAASGVSQRLLVRDRARAPELPGASVAVASYDDGAAGVYALGNVVSNLGVAVTVNVTLGGSRAGTVTPATVTIPAAGPATSTAPVQYKSPASGNYTDTLTLSVNEYGVNYSSQAASFTQ